jgi:hypothetical protein
MAMAKRLLRNRPLTAEEAEHYCQIRVQIAAELPEILRRAQSAKRRIRSEIAIPRDKHSQEE